MRPTLTGDCPPFNRVISAGGVAVAYIFLPERLQRAMQLTSVQDAPSPHDTSFLDGFRGLVVFLVCVRHFLLPWCQGLDIGFLDGADHAGAQRLPVFRMLYSGPNVPVMLVVSGFVLSLKPTTRYYAGDRMASYDTLASSTLRRPFRLFLPPIVSSAVVACMAQMGFFDYPYHALPGYKAPHPWASSIQAQIVDWIQFVLQELTFPWTWETSSPVYGAHLWTIPVQFRCSLLLSLLLAVLARMRGQFRVIVLFAIWAYSFTNGRWDVATYLAGTLIAEWQVRRNTPKLPTAAFTDRTESHSHLFWQHFLKAGLLAFSLFSGSFPRKRAEIGALGYEWCYWLSSDYHVWHALSGIGLVVFVCLSQAAQKVLNMQPIRYLGRISFALYLVHEPLLHIYALKCVDSAWRLTGNSTTFSFSLGLLLAFAIAMPVIIWIADIFQRLVVIPCSILSGKIDRNASTQV